MQVKAGHNSAMVAGTVTKDAEYKTIGENDTPVVSFSAAVNARGEAGAFANCKAFGSLLANYARNIKKGDAVFAVGVIETREYNGKTYTDLNCQWLNFIGKSGAAASPYPAPYSAPLPSQPAPYGFTAFEEQQNNEEAPF